MEKRLYLLHWYQSPQFLQFHSKMYLPKCLNCDKTQNRTTGKRHSLQLTSSAFNIHIYSVHATFTDNQLIIIIQITDCHGLLPRFFLLFFINLTINLFKINTRDVRMAFSIELNIRLFELLKTLEFKNFKIIKSFYYFFKKRTVLYNTKTKLYQLFELIKKYLNNRKLIEYTIRIFIWIIHITFITSYQTFRIFAHLYVNTHINRNPLHLNVDT